MTTLKTSLPLWGGEGIIEGGGGGTFEDFIFVAAEKGGKGTDTRGFGENARHFLQ